MSQNPMRRARLLLTALILLGSALTRTAHAVELTWDEGVSRIRVHVEKNDYQVARKTLVILLRDYPEKDEVFALDTYFALGDNNEAARLLSHLAYHHTRSLFDKSRSRVTDWSIFSDRLDALEYHVALRPGDDKARLVLGYYLLISGMPMRGERIFSKIHTTAPEWEVAQILLDASEGRFGYAKRPHTLAPGKDQGIVYVQVREPVVQVKDRPSPPSHKDSHPEPFVQLGFGALLMPGTLQGDAAPATSIALGLTSARGYTVALKSTAAPRLNLLLDNARKEISLHSVGLGVSYSGPAPRTARLRPVLGAGLDLMAATPLSAKTALGLGASGTLGLTLSLPLNQRQSALHLGVEATGRKPLLSEDANLQDLPAFFTVGGNLGLSF